MNKGRKRVSLQVYEESGPIAAGEFSVWLHETRHARTVGNLGADVPCGSCTACCRSSMFIHIRPDEKALKRIPKALLFPAPGLPKGHMVMGYDEKGRCPMLVDDRCSIYAHRPQTCRDFDCRIFAATGIQLHEAQEQIAERVRRWTFAYPSGRDQAEQDAVRASAAFLQEHRDCLPPGLVPDHPVPLAVMAVMVYDAFYELNAASGTTPKPSDAEIARAVRAAVERHDAARPSPPNSRR